MDNWCYPRNAAHPLLGCSTTGSTCIFVRLINAHFLLLGLRHTDATELASSDVSVYTLMKLLGHESMTTSQRYVSAAGAETRSPAARNPIYAMTPSGGEAPAT